MMKCGMLSWSFRSKTKKFPRPARRRQAGPGLRPGAIQPRRLAAVRRRRNPLLISPSPARGNQLNFRFYRSPQRAKYSCAPGALIKNASSVFAFRLYFMRDSPEAAPLGRLRLGKPTAGWFSMSGRKAAKELRDALVLPAHGAGIRIVTYGLWTRFETRVLLKPGADTGFQ